MKQIRLKKLPRPASRIEEKKESSNYRPSLM
jgi:hypothetical protein